MGDRSERTMLLTPNEYQQHCLKTWQGGGGRSTTEELANAGMGLVGEAGEVANELKKVLWCGQPLDAEAIADELGDVLYYAAILTHRLGVMFEAVRQKDVDRTVLEDLGKVGIGLAAGVGKIANELKKVLWYGKPLDVEAIADELGGVLHYAAILAQYVGVTLEVVMQGNIEKLAARHPEGFDNSRYVDDMRPRGALADVGPVYTPKSGKDGYVYRDFS